MARVYGGWRFDELRDQHRRRLSSDRNIRWSHPQGGKARRYADSAANQVRIGHQPQNRQGTRPGRATRTNRRCQRGDRVKRRAFIALFGGAAVVWPMAAPAQQAEKIPTIGVLWHAGSAEQEAPYFNAVIEGFKGLGYVEGRNIRFEHRFPNDTPDRFRSLAAELVSLKVDVIVTWGGATAPYAKDATTTIPIVFGLDPDPVGNKLVASFARPGDNITGFTSFVPDLAQK